MPLDGDARFDTRSTETESYAPRSPNLHPLNTDQQTAAATPNERYTPKSPRLGYFSDAARAGLTKTAGATSPWGASNSSASSAVRRTSTYQPPILELNKSPEYASYTRRHSTYVPPIPIDQQGQGGGFGGTGSLYNSPVNSRANAWTSPRDQRGYVPPRQTYSPPRAALNYTSHSRSTSERKSSSISTGSGYQPPPILSNPLSHLKLEDQNEAKPYDYQQKVDRNSSSASYSTNTDTDMSGVKMENGGGDVKMGMISPSGSDPTIPGAPSEVKAEVKSEASLGPSHGIEVKTKFPVARIKRIMQADEEVGKVAQVTPVAVSKALELFMISLVTKSAALAREANSKRVTAVHLKKVIEADEQFDFLNEIVAKVPDAPDAGQEKGASRRKKKDEESSGEEEKPKKKGRRRRGE